MGEGADAGRPHKRTHPLAIPKEEAVGPRPPSWPDLQKKGKGLPHSRLGGEVCVLGVSR